MNQCENLALFRWNLKNFSVFDFSCFSFYQIYIHLISFIRLQEMQPFSFSFKGLTKALTFQRLKINLTTENECSGRLSNTERPQKKTKGHNDRIISVIIDMTEVTSLTSNIPVVKSNAACTEHWTHCDALLLSSSSCLRAQSH